MNRRSRSPMYFFALLLMGFALLSVAQQTSSTKPAKGTAEIPFEFWASEKTMPAGQYTIETTAPSVVVLNNSKDHTVQQMFTLPEGGSAADTNDAKLVFYQRKGKYYLVGLRNADGRQRLVLFRGVSPQAGDVRREIAIKYEP
jgi:hypothetical protein